MHFIDKESLYYMFLEIQKLHYNRSLLLLDEIGVYPGQPHLLFILNKMGGQSQKELAEKLNVKPSTITIMLKRMEKTNLVERKQDDKDQRISRVYITEQGRKICKRSKEILGILEEECFGNLSLEDKENLKRLFLQIRDNLKNNK
ncbi:MarR family winged helix-turn-helix transcriptional regulator [Tissierella praeacuta]|uniref:MarR family winged helix-turn-helix transcriptional regulator n=1 Tax=Tissierella praeacuta TaxID=43131 RepID=UPI0028B08AFB|nr:MarR family transcriptional regulator [Tissierella praeacuta]